MKTLITLLILLLCSCSSIQEKKDIINLASYQDIDKGQHAIVYTIKKELFNQHLYIHEEFIEIVSMNRNYLEYQCLDGFCADLPPTKILGRDIVKIELLESASEDINKKLGYNWSYYFEKPSKTTNESIVESDINLYKKL